MYWNCATFSPSLFSCDYPITDTMDAKVNFPSHGAHRKCASLHQEGSYPEYLEPPSTMPSAVQRVHGYMFYRQQREIEECLVCRHERRFESHAGHLCMMPRNRRDKPRGNRATMEYRT